MSSWPALSFPAAEPISGGKFWATDAMVEVHDTVWPGGGPGGDPRPPGRRVVHDGPA